MPSTIEQYRKACAAADYIQIPNDKKFRIMWRWADQFGVRNDETGEQYSFQYDEVESLNIVFLILCPVDIGSF